jgi:RimJ/RimL family protein N-acetyltransferase
MEILTPRLRLREFLPTDVNAVLRYQNDPEYLKFYEWESRTPLEVQEFIGLFIDWQQEEPRSRYQLAIVLRQSGKLIGNVGIRQMSVISSEAELGYELDPQYWGLGYASEATQAMIDFAFNTLGVLSISAIVIAENQRAQNVIERLGMRLIDRYHANQYFKGRWWDTLSYVLSESDWIPNHPDTRKII